MTLLANNQLGVVQPPRAAPPLPDKDAREYALERLRDYICALEFRRTNAPGQPAIGFQLPEASVQIQQPDDLVDLPLPGVGIVPGFGVHDTLGLGPPQVLEETRDQFAPGTALVLLGEYTERIAIEVWGSKVAERRGMMAGLKSALRASDTSSAVYLTLPDYYDMTAAFELLESQYVEGDEPARNRRRSHVFVLLRVCEVRLVNVVPLNVSAEVLTLDGSVVSAIDC